MAVCGTCNGVVRICGPGAKPHNLAKEQLNQPLSSSTVILMFWLWVLFDDSTLWENPGNKGSQQAVHKRSSKQCLNHRRIYGIKFCQTHEIKIDTVLNVEKNFPVIRTVESWHSLLVRTENHATIYQVFAWCLALCWALMHTIPLNPHSNTLSWIYLLKFNKRKTQGWKCLESGFETKAIWPQRLCS